MKRLVLLRNGQSVWNRENRFTGWTDVPLSAQGIAEAIKAGQMMKEEGLNFEQAYTSFLMNGIKTLWLVLEEMNIMWIPVVKHWRLNEKHYGMLQEMNKVETTEKYGSDKVLLWRRSFNISPPPLASHDDRNPKLDRRYASLCAAEVPLTESLKQVIERILPYWETEIKPALKEKNDVLVVGHGNSLRALAMHLKNMSPEEIVEFNIPNAIPYVFEFNDNMTLQRNYFLGDPEEVRRLMQEVAKQAEKF